MSAAEENILKNLAGEMSHYESQILPLLANMEKECYENAGDDSERYVTCMFKYSKKMSKSQKELDLRLGFFRHTFSQCLKQKTPEECETSGKTKLNDIFGKFIKNLK